MNWTPSSERERERVPRCRVRARCAALNLNCTRERAGMSLSMPVPAPVKPQRAKHKQEGSGRQATAQTKPAPAPFLSGPGAGGTRVGVQPPTEEEEEGTCVPSCSSGSGGTGRERGLSCGCLGWPRRRGLSSRLARVFLRWRPVVADDCRVPSIAERSPPSDPSIRAPMNAAGCVRACVSRALRCDCESCDFATATASVCVVWGCSGLSVTCQPSVAYSRPGRGVAWLGRRAFMAPCRVMCTRDPRGRGLGGRGVQVER